MARKSQAERLTLALGLVEQLALHLKVALSMLLPGSEEVQEQIQGIANWASQLQDDDRSAIIIESFKNEVGG